MSYKTEFFSKFWLHFGQSHLKILSKSLINELIKTLTFESFGEFYSLKMKFAKDTKVYFYKSKEGTEINQTMTVHMLYNFLF